MAEACFRETVKNAGYADSFDVIDSCGTAGYHVGLAPDSRMLLDFIHQYYGGGLIMHSLHFTGTVSTLKENGVSTVCQIK